MVFKILLFYWAFSTLYCAIEVARNWDDIIKDDDFSFLPTEFIRFAAFFFCILSGWLFTPLSIYIDLKFKLYKISLTSYIKVKYFFRNTRQRVHRIFYIWGWTKKDPDEPIKIIASEILNIFIDSQRFKNFFNNERKKDFDSVPDNGAQGKI